MIRELEIRNFALIESLRIRFGDKLNAMTGETGAGKSIVVDALGLLLGDKAQASVVRKGAERCQILGIFDTGRNRAAAKLLKELSLENEGEDLILRREIDAQGKSRAFVNDRPVTLSTLSSLGDHLIELHSQHEHQKLLKSAEQRDFLDRYAEAWDLRAQAAEAFALWKALLEKKEASQISDQERNQKIDLYAFQVKEIEDAKLKPGEEEELDEALPRLKNAEKIRAALDEAYGHLYEDEGSVSDRLRKVKRSLDNLTVLGMDLKEVPRILEEVLVGAEEMAGEIEKARGNIVSDPSRLDAIFSRQDLISKLKRKYGATLADIIAYGAKIKGELDILQNYAENIGNLEKEIEASQASFMKKAKALSAARRKEGENLASAVEKELKDLGFLKARFAVQLVSEPPSAAGLEAVEFLLSANPGEDLKPIKAVASGGELSRIMLALKKILAQADMVPTLIFDEVDAGIGGAMGNIIGEKLKGLGKTHQVIAITHLPQVAAFAECHIAVRKEVRSARTQTEIELLGKDARVEEIARMLGGVSSISLKHAAELLSEAGKK
ncbi:MAG: DNA repair protein RecN [Elusimicrobia bacterium RIFCSPLOWO2_01_FULL_60_11]|nr:MAG: DNA repair protein RecN [Elusimicrobia bacterium RIFCSPLOWO2_01_FULL_60_11]